MRLKQNKAGRQRYYNKFALVVSVRMADHCNNSCYQPNSNRCPICGLFHYRRQQFQLYRSMSRHIRLIGQHTHILVLHHHIQSAYSLCLMKTGNPQKTQKLLRRHSLNFDHSFRNKHKYIGRCLNCF